MTYNVGKVTAIILFANLTIGTALAQDSLSLSALKTTQGAIDEQFELADTLTDKVQEIESALIAYYAQNNYWPSSLSEIISDGFYVGNLMTPFGGQITGSINVNTYQLSLSGDNETISTYLASELNGSVTALNITRDIGTPAESSLLSTTLSRVYDVANSGAANTMATSLLMSGNDVIDIGNLTATGNLTTTGNVTGAVINATAEIRENGVRVFSLNNLPNKSNVGLGNVSNFSISDNYIGGSSSLYASQKSITDAYNALSSSKLGKSDTAVNSQLLDGLDSSDFVRTNTRINGKALTSDINLTAGDVGAVPITGGTYSGNVHGTWFRAPYLETYNTADTSQRLLITGSGFAPRKADDSDWDWNTRFVFDHANRRWKFTGDTFVETGELKLADNIKLKLGSGTGNGDTVIKHTGTTSFIEQYTGDLNLRALSSGNDIFIGAENTSGTFYNAASTGTGTNVDFRLYYNGQNRLTTVSDGVNLYGKTTTNYASYTHNDSHHYLNFRGVGDAYIRNLVAGADIYLNVENDDGSSDVPIRVVAGGTANTSYVDLRYGDSQKLKTTSSGVDVTGQLDTDGVYSTGWIRSKVADNAVAFQATNSTGRNFDLKVPSGSVDPFKFSTSNSFAVEIDGSVDFHVEDTGELYAGAKGTNRIYHEGYKPTKADVGLSNVQNYGISNSYTSSSSTSYASSKAVRDAYNTLNSAKLNVGAKAADSNLLDGLDSTAFVRTTRTINGKALSSNVTLSASDVGAIANQSGNTAVNNKLYTQNGAKLASTSSDSISALSIGQNTKNADAFITFHIGGDYAANLGIDGTTNRLSYGGWSAGNNSYAIYHEGYKPTASDVGIGNRSNWNNSSASYDSVVGQLAWRNYGNGYTIFDASSGQSPSNTTINNSTPNFGWTASYPSLMGWNGANTYGVRVDVASKLYYGNDKKVEANNTGIKVTGTVYSDSGFQSDYMNGYHAGNSYIMVPFDDGSWQSAREFGYDSTNNRWFVDTDLKVAGNVIANDVIAGGTSMSDLKADVDALSNGGGGGGGVVKTIFSSSNTNRQPIVANLSEPLVVGASYYIETNGKSADDRCGGTQNYNVEMEFPQFVIFKYGSGGGQQVQVSGSCSGYTVYQTLKVINPSYLRIEAGVNDAYTVAIRKVIKLG